MRHFLVKFLIRLLVLAVLLPMAALQLLPRRYPCQCPDELQPVCGRDRRTYPNICKMECAKQSMAHRGECRRGGY